MTHLLRTPPRREALRHSGGANLLWTSAMVTLYFEVEESSESRPGTEQKTSEESAGRRRPPSRGLQSSPLRPQTTCGSPPHYLHYLPSSFLMASGTSGARKAWLRPPWYTSSLSTCLRWVESDLFPPALFLPSDWVVAKTLDQVGLGEGVHTVRVAVDAVLALCQVLWVRLILESPGLD